MYPAREELDRFVRTFHVDGARIVNLQSGVVTASGDPLVGQPLLRSLAGSPGAARRLDASLAGQPLPRIWTQGDIGCLVWKPKPEHLLLCAFATLPGGAVGAYKRGKQMDAAVAELFETAPPTTPTDTD